MTYPGILKNLNGRGFFQIKPGLERMQRVAKALEHPERRWAALHIAGTNGKGSVSATLENILRHAGYKTGLYTSPHLVALGERIRVNGRPISNLEFASCGSRLIQIEKKLGLRLTYFEFVTALAFLHFAEVKIDVGVLECGMGGRWDATNIIPRPVASVITSIGLDHTAWLGNTLSAIAHEKAGIIKEDGCTISGVGAEAQSVIRNEAMAKRNSFSALHQDFAGFPLHADWQKPLQSWSYRTLSSPRRKPGTSPLNWIPAFAGMTTRHIQTPLMGRHQVDNGAITMTVVDLLRAQGWGLSDKAVARGFQTVQWPGRLQVLQKARHPMVLLDGAHNPHAMKKLLQTLKDPFFKRKRKVFIFSAFSDKDVAGMARQIGPMAERIYLCEMMGSRRSTLADLAKLFARFSTKLVSCSEGIDEAIARAWRETPPADCIVATGSLMLIGEILKKKRLFHG